MPDIDTLLLTNLLGNGLQSYGITDDVFKTEAVSTLISKLVNEIQNIRTQQQGEVQQLQQKQNELLDSIDKTSKIGDAMLDALKDKASPQPLPQQDMNAIESAQPAPQEQPPVPPASDAGMTPPPEMNVPPAPDMGVPATDAGMIPPAQPAPDMMQIDPNMLGAIQPRF
jgi:hypothetical protein